MTDDPRFQSAGDRSNGYEGVAAAFIAQRSPSIGVATVRAWAKELPPGAVVLDLGCGHGRPLTQFLFDEGFSVYGVDASASLVAALHAGLPAVRVECAAVEDSTFFGRAFDGVIAWGLLFLLPAGAQALLIGKVARALNPAGRFLFTSPRQACEWADTLTGQPSVSLGRDAYRRILAAEGFLLLAEREDEGGNHYYLARKPPQSPIG